MQSLVKNNFNQSSQGWYGTGFRLFLKTRLNINYELINFSLKLFVQSNIVFIRNLKILV